LLLAVAALTVALLLAVVLLTEALLRLLLPPALLPVALLRLLLAPALLTIALLRLLLTEVMLGLLLKSHDQISSLPNNKMDRSISIGEIWRLVPCSRRFPLNIAANDMPRLTLS
jgi:hypothetical protein